MLYELCAVRRCTSHLVAWEVLEKTPRGVFPPVCEKYRETPKKKRWASNPGQLNQKYFLLNHASSAETSRLMRFVRFLV
jgi:hypothetical protein